MSDSLMLCTHKLDIRVIFRDVDMGKIVHHPNYMFYLEAGREGWFNMFGVDLNELIIGKDYGMMVCSFEISYNSPIFLGDVVTIETRLVDRARVSFTFLQKIWRDGKLLTNARVKVVGAYVDKYKPAILPREYAGKLL
ncbi:acyl-CoA thioesterase [Serratia ureilytica]|uniref:acyl-CoA thioesterase n=1 Tax=Serratia ureilytica TaxID=300181 RepID=UPI0011C7CDC0|nr:thioesterase family protein [Serratia ureilytica]MBS7522790.1 acyl-CoA thioesterase [Serratia ureilytica]TXE50065.1 acyl-CoA thioesterase [Serratia ureilytica]